MGTSAASVMAAGLGENLLLDEEVENGEAEVSRGEAEVDENFLLDEEPVTPTGEVVSGGEAEVEAVEEDLFVEEMDGANRGLICCTAGITKWV